MSLIKANFSPSTRDLRLFAGLGLPLLLTVVAAIVWLKSGRFPTACGLVLATAAVVGLLGWTQPERFRLVFLLWMGLVFPIGWIVSYLALWVLFYFLFTPIGLLMRLFGRDPLNRHLDRSAQTYWEPLDSGGSVDQYFRQY